MKSPAYKIITDRLTIRCFEPIDAYLLKESIDESLEHLKKWLKWANDEPEDIEKKVERIRKIRASFDLDENYTYGIFLQDNSKLVGVIGLMKRIGPNAFEIGYWLHKDYTNKGYMTEATKAIIKVFFEVNKTTRLEIHCDPENSQSKAIPKKLGFTNEAIRRKNELDTIGNHKNIMIWVLFDEEYEKSFLKETKVMAYNILDERIIT